jgi:hypothetical protein
VNDAYLCQRFANLGIDGNQIRLALKAVVVVAQVGELE